MELQVQEKSGTKEPSLVRSRKSPSLILDGKADEEPLSWKHCVTHNTDPPFKNFQPRKYLRT